ncbi:MAG: hypothetical protein AAFY88_20465, partial [Acidobacteriota bacterium]
IAMLVPLYFCLITAYGLTMATLQGEPTPGGDEIWRLLAEKLPVSAFLVFLETVPPQNAWLVLCASSVAWLAKDKLVWNRNDPEDLFHERKRRGSIFVFVALVLLIKLLMEWAAAGHPVWTSLAYGCSWVLLFTACTVAYHDQRLLALEETRSEEEVQLALAEARRGQAQQH